MAARSWPLLLRGQGSFRVGATDFWDTVIERHPIDVVDLGSERTFARYGQKLVTLDQAAA